MRNMYKQMLAELKTIRGLKYIEKESAELPLESFGQARVLDVGSKMIERRGESQY